MMHSQLKNLKVDNVLKGYRLVKNIYVTEFKMTALELIHEKTNAKHFHLIRDDRNKTFGVQFRTPPPNSSGVPHILEHTVLCGSDKYPVRDPFFKMLTRSQATFMNAMTANDWTIYPFSSMNTKDYFNLLSVYLDAVFKPKLSEQDFMQEGWRLEPQNLSDISTNFNLKGVVYNEMKGVFSNSMNYLGYTVEQNLLPETYPHNSGGDPNAIPFLSYEQLKSFHRKLYHPSNSKFFTYGDVDLEAVLSRINDDYLQNYSKLDIDTSIRMEPRWTSPKRININCQTDPMAANPDRQSSVVVSFVIDDSHKSYLNFTMGVISNLLLSGDNSPLYQVLIESGIGQDWAGNLCGFDSSNRTTTFHMGIQGVLQADMDKVEDIINSVLLGVIRDGFPSERIASLIHQIELGLRHDKANFGLKLIMGLSSGLNHDSSLEDILKSLEYVRKIKNDLSENPKYLQNIVKKYLFDNQHRLTVFMSPKETFDKEKLTLEQNLIENLNKDLSDNERISITEKCKNLLEAQRTTEDVNCLPCLQISDIPIECEKYPFKMSSDQRYYINEYGTNGILYLKMLFDLGGIESALIPYLPLFSSVITSMSTSNYHYREIDQAAESCSGGLDANLHLSGNINDLNSADISCGLLLSSHCLYENSFKMMDLWRDIICEIQFKDIDRLSTLIKMETTGSWSADGISNSAHQYAMRRASSRLSPLGRLSECWNGLEQAKLMKSLANMSNSSLEENIIPKLIQLKEIIFNKNRLKIAINCEESAVTDTLSLLNTFEQDLIARPYEQVPMSLDCTMEKNCRFVLPFTVNYVSTALKSVPYTHSDYAKTRILSKLLSSKYLHNQIREIGGAYGGGVTVSPGHLKFYSYRDPHSTETLGAFERSLEWAINENITEQLLNEAKLSVFQEIDKPISAGSKGLIHFMEGISDEIRQQQRERLFNVTIKDLKEVAESLRNSSDKSSVIIGPEQEIESDWQKIVFN